MQRAILLYDGHCGFCDRVVQFTLRRDRNDVFRFAPLQSSIAAEILRRHGLDSAALHTVVLVLDPQQPAEHLLVRSDAALGVLSTLGAPWSLVAVLGRCCPKAIRDRVYDWVARVRYRVFGRYSSCLVPTTSQQQKFLAW